MGTLGNGTVFWGGLFGRRGSYATTRKETRWRGSAKSGTTVRLQWPVPEPFGHWLLLEWGEVGLTQPFEHGSSGGLH
jgi:hypothetical protein